MLTKFSIMTLSITQHFRMTRGRMTLSRMALDKMTFSIQARRRVTISRLTFSIKMTLNRMTLRNYIQHNDTKYTDMQRKTVFHQNYKQTSNTPFFRMQLC